MRKGLSILVLLVVILLGALIFFNTQTPTGYAISHEEIQRIIAEGQAAEVSEAPSLSPQGEQEAIVATIVKNEAAEVNTITRVFKRFFGKNKHLDLNLNGIVDIDDAVIAIQRNARALSEDIIAEIYTSQGGTYLGPLATTTCPNQFIRGDADQDTKVDVADAVYILDYTFGKGKEPVCDDSLDVNDDGKIETSDAIYTLQFIFNKGPEPEAPYKTKGYDEQNIHTWSLCDNIDNDKDTFIDEGEPCSNKP